MNPSEIAERPSAWFVVEGGARTGWGHLSRSLHLAEAWCRAGGAATCVGALEADVPGDWFPPEIPLLRLPESCRTSEDLLTWFHARLRRSRPDWLVLDGYGFEETLAAGLRRLGPGLVRLDDPTLPATLSPPRAADLLVLPGPFPPEFVPSRPAGRVLAGLEYLLVRRPAPGPELPPEPDDTTSAALLSSETHGGCDPTAASVRRPETIGGGASLVDRTRQPETIGNGGVSPAPPHEPETFAGGETSPQPISQPKPFAGGGVPSNPFRLLGTFGGADPYRRAETLAAALRLLPAGTCRMTLLVPAQHPGWPRLASLAADLPNPADLEILPARRDWGRLLDRADAVWCAAGTTAWEVVTAGKPCGVSLDADNQRINHAALTHAGWARDLGHGSDPTPARWAELLRSWVSQPVLESADTAPNPTADTRCIQSVDNPAADGSGVNSLVSPAVDRAAQPVSPASVASDRPFPEGLGLKLAEPSAEVANAPPRIDEHRTAQSVLPYSVASQPSRPDGRGAERIVAAMRRGTVRLRPAEGNDDLEALFAWANDPDTRAASRRTEPIERATHEAWFARCLARPAETWLRIAVDGTGRRLGTIRFDRTKEPGVRLAALALDPAVRGQGWAGRLIRLATAELAAAPPGEIVLLRAAIKPWNERSRRAFESAGYVRSRAPALPDCDLFDLDPRRPPGSPADER